MECIKRLAGKLQDDEKQAIEEGLEAFTISQQAELFEVLVPEMALSSAMASRSNVGRGTKLNSKFQFSDKPWRRQKENRMAHIGL